MKHTRIEERTNNIIKDQDDSMYCLLGLSLDLVVVNWTCYWLVQINWVLPLSSSPSSITNRSHFTGITAGSTLHQFGEHGFLLTDLCCCHLFVSMICYWFIHLCWFNEDISCCYSYIIFHLVKATRTSMFRSYSSEIRKNIICILVQ